MPDLLGESMDLREYFRKVRAVEATIREPLVWVVSLKTGDGGRKGVRSLVTRESAARFVVDGKVDLDGEHDAADGR